MSAPVPGCVVSIPREEGSSLYICVKSGPLPFQPCSTTDMVDEHETHLQQKTRRSGAFSLKRILLILSPVQRVPWFLRSTHTQRLAVGLTTPSTPLSMSTVFQTGLAARCSRCNRRLLEMQRRRRYSAKHGHEGPCYPLTHEHRGTSGECPHRLEIGARARLCVNGAGRSGSLRANDGDRCDATDGRVVSAVH